MTTNRTISDMVVGLTRSTSRNIAAGAAILAVLCATAVIWGVLVPLSGAVIASGFVVVEGNLRRVQHPTGGIVGAVFVQEGTHVQSGELLVRLDETATRANLAVIVNELTALRVRLARLLADRIGAETIEFPPDIVERAAADAEVRKAVDNEQNLFDSEVRNRKGLREQLRERIVQTREEIVGLEAQREALTAQVGLANEEKRDVDTLYNKQLVQRTRVTQLEREIIRINGSVGDMTARIAQSRGRISEVELQILQIDKERAADVAKTIRETETRIGELNERKLAAEDQLRRIDIRSPGTGFVHQLTIHTVGGVIAAGETIMQIVPENETLVVEVRINPSDIEQVRVGQAARVKFTGFNPRTTPELDGAVSRVSADLTRDEKTNIAFYTAAIKVPDSELARLGQLTLQPGMPAEVFLRTHDRTLGDFLLQPLLERMDRAMRED